MATPRTRRPPIATTLPAPWTSVDSTHSRGTEATDSRPHQRVYDQEAGDEPYRQKRRANLFAQYGEGDFIHAGYDARPLQYLQQPTHHRQSPTDHSSRHQSLQPTPPPAPLHGHSTFSHNYDRHSSLQSMSDTSPRDPMVQQDARRVHPVQTEQPPIEPIQRERKSRYLSESDRRSIILRIENGEKQVALAKEYQVSRAAVCNLYKNRKEVLTRAIRDPKTKPLKRAKDKEKNKHLDEAVAGESPTEEKDQSHGDDELMSDELSSTESFDAASPRVTVDTAMSNRSPSVGQRRVNATPPDQVLRVHNASATSFPIRRMVSILRNPQLPQPKFRHVTKRLMRSLIEEVVVCFPHREVTVVTPSGDSVSSVLPVEDDFVCAISMEDNGMALLQAFLDIFPASPSGTLSLSRRSDQSSDAWTASSNRLPLMYSNSCVLLLTTSCSTGAREAAALESLVGYSRISPANIYVVTVIASQPGLARVHQQFPDVTIVTAAVDDRLDEQGHIRPGLGDLMGRFWFPEPAQRLHVSP